MDENINSIFGIQGLKDTTVESDDSVFVEGVLEPEKSCPRCCSKHLHRQTKGHRLLLLPPTGGKPAKVQVLVQKQRCVKCNYMWWPKVPFAHGRQRVSQSFVTYALELLKFGTILDVSKHLYPSKLKNRLDAA